MGIQAKKSKQEGWRNRATLSVTEAAPIVGLTVNAAYAAVKRGDIPSVRFGGLIKIPVHQLRQKLGEI